MSTKEEALLKAIEGILPYAEGDLESYLDMVGDRTIGEDPEQDLEDAEWIDRAKLRLKAAYEAIENAKARS
jgi:hypothetical protein